MNQKKREEFQEAKPLPASGSPDEQLVVPSSIHAPCLQMVAARITQSPVADGLADALYADAIWPEVVSNCIKYNKHV